MSALADPFEARRAVNAAGLLRAFSDTGLLSAADVHVAMRLAALAGEEDDAVKLAVALAVRGPRLGHVFVDLATIRDSATVESDEPVDLSTLPWPAPGDWITAVRASPLVALGDDDTGSAEPSPLRLLGTRLYLDRYWREERAVAADLKRLAARDPEVDESALEAGLQILFPREADRRQRDAAAEAVRRRFAVVAGGPGTGKTTTVARIVALLAGRPPRAACGAARRARGADRQGGGAAPGGGARRDGAIAGQRLDPRPADGPARVDASPAPRLAARQPQSLRPPPSRPPAARRRDRRRDLDGVAVADGAAGRGGPSPTRGSCSWGTRASSPRSRPVWCWPTSWPSGRASSCSSGCTATAEASRGWPVPCAAATLTQAVAALRSAPEEITWLASDLEDGAAAELPLVRERAVAAGAAVFAAARDGAARDALAALATFRLLCAHRRGPHGVSDWTSQVQAWLGAETPDLDVEQRDYVGRPLLVTENDYELGLYNGDTGVIVQNPGGHPIAAVRARARSPALQPVAPRRSVDTVYAMTIHKSQGSQFDTAAVLLPPAGSRILTRELLYTAITRARRELILVGSEEALREAVERPVARASGLGERLSA